MSDPSLGWLAAAFALSWIIIGIYLVRLARAQRAIDERMEELDRTTRKAPDEPLG